MRLYEWSPHFQLIYKFEDYINTFQELWYERKLDDFSKQDSEFLTKRFEYFDKSYSPSLENLLLYANS